MVPPVLMYSTFSTPALAAAFMMLRVPSTLGRMMACSGSVAHMRKPAAVWYTRPQPSTARATSAESRMSPYTTWTSRPSSGAGSALARIMARTGSPRCTSRRQMLLPTWPLAPVTRVGRMRTSRARFPPDIGPVARDAQAFSHPADARQETEPDRAAAGVELEHARSVGDPARHLCHDLLEEGGGSIARRRQAGRTPGLPPAPPGPPRPRPSHAPRAGDWCWSVPGCSSPPGGAVARRPRAGSREPLARACRGALVVGDQHNLRARGAPLDHHLEVAQHPAVRAVGIRRDAGPAECG